MTDVVSRTCWVFIVHAEEGDIFLDHSSSLPIFGFHISPFQVYCADVVGSPCVLYLIAHYKHISRRKPEREKIEQNPYQWKNIQNNTHIMGTYRSCVLS